MCAMSAHAHDALTQPFAKARAINQPRSECATNERKIITKSPIRTRAQSG